MKSFKIYTEKEVKDETNHGIKSEGKSMSFGKLLLIILVVFIIIGLANNKIEDSKDNSSKIETNNVNDSIEQREESLEKQVTPDNLVESTEDKEELTDHEENEVESDKIEKNEDIITNDEYTEEKKKEIYKEKFFAESKAREQAEAKYPSPFNQNLIINQSYTLTEETPLMPEWNPTDPIAAIAEMKQLPGGTTILIHERVVDGTWVWFSVDTSPIGSGWINSTALIGQFPDQEKEYRDNNYNLFTELLERNRTIVKKKYDLDEESETAILDEGDNNNW